MQYRSLCFVACAACFSPSHVAPGAMEARAAENGPMFSVDDNGCGAVTVLLRGGPNKPQAFTLEIGSTRLPFDGFPADVCVAADDGTTCRGHIHHMKEDEVGLIVDKSCKHVRAKREGE